MEVIIILLLIILNGIFAMAEIAIVSARKSRLKQLANQGNTNAQKTLDLANNPNQFLATVQIGITFIGIFAGAFGGKTIAKSVSGYISPLPLIGTYSENIALFLVVALITYLSLVIGELVPKRLALSSPESIATFMAQPMQTLSSFSFPLVKLLSISTDWILKIFKVKESPEVSITEEEVRMLIKEGARMGVFNLAERDIVERTFRLSDKKVTALMTPRKEIKWLDINTTAHKIRKAISRNSYSYYPVCRDNLDKVIGVIRTKEVLTHFLTEKKPDIQKYLRKPLFVPVSMDSLKVLELFKKSGIHVALVVDEYGAVEGLLSLTDILEAIVGDIPTIDELEDKTIVQREDGSWLVDGLVTLDEFKEKFRLRKLPNEITGQFHTIGGFVIYKLGSIPMTGDAFDLDTFRFEVVDMDGNRVDKVLVKQIKSEIKQ